MEAVLILRDPPNSGAWNMAVDEALLERAKEIGPVLRFYEWSPATLSLGYFQSARQRLLHPPSRNCPLVRRPSGGGAILHDRELTYALVVPAGHPWARSREQLYFMVHEALAETLVRWGIRASLVEGKECRPDQGAELAPEVSSGMPTSGPLAAGGVGKADDPAAAEQVVPAWDLACGTQLRVSEASLSAADQPFMCFARRSCGDLVVGPYKIAGSAQRRTATGILQHGSILLGRSPYAPEFPGLRELSAQVISADELTVAFLEVLAVKLPADFCPGTVDPKVLARAQELLVTKYSSPGWTERIP